MKGKYLALLRGINVGGKNIIKKDDLKKAFEDMGFTDVRTYIASGNILFRAEPEPVELLKERVEQILSKRFSYDARAVVYSEKKYRSIVESAPPNWGKDSDYRHSLLFIITDVNAKELLEGIKEPDPEIETITARPGAIFGSMSKAYLSKSRLSKIASLPAYKQVTIRNHTTVYRLQELLEEM